MPEITSESNNKYSQQNKNINICCHLVWEIFYTALFSQ